MITTIRKKYFIQILKLTLYAFMFKIYSIEMIFVCCVIMIVNLIQACEHFSASIPSHTSFHLGSNNLRKDIDNNNIKNNTNNSHKSSTLRNDTFHYNSRSKRHSFNNCISNRRYDSYFDNHTLRNRNKNKHSTTKDDSEADELSKSLPWTFSEKVSQNYSTF